MALNIPVVKGGLVIFAAVLKDRLIKLENIAKRIDEGTDHKSDRKNNRTDEVNGEIELIKELLKKLQD